VAHENPVRLKLAWIAGWALVVLLMALTAKFAYPQAESAGFAILDGVVTADGLGVDFKPGPDAALFGITTMPTATIKPSNPDWSDGATKGWKQLEFRVTGWNRVGELPLIERRIGNMGNWRCLVFQEGSKESCGLIPWGWQGSSGYIGENFTIDRKTPWLGTPEMLKPGAKLRVGIHGPLPNEAVNFALDLPDLVPPR